VSSIEDLYEMLQVHRLAEPEIIEAAYRRLTLKYHPDRNKSPDANGRMTRLNLAYETLSDPTKRAKYDRERADNSRGPQPGASSSSSQGARSGPQPGASGSSSQGARSGPKAGASASSSQGARSGPKAGASASSSQGARTSRNGSDDGIYEWVTQRLSNGVRPDLIVDQLVREGWPREKVVSFVWAMHAQKLNGKGAKRPRNWMPIMPGLSDKVVKWTVISLLISLYLLAKAV